MILANKPFGMLAERASLIFLDLVHNVTKLDIRVFSPHICVHQNDACSTFQNKSSGLSERFQSNFCLLCKIWVHIYVLSQCNAHATCRQATEEQTFDYWQEQNVFPFKSSRQAQRPPSISNGRRGKKAEA